jgi:hypothetical protein
MTDISTYSRKAIICHMLRHMLLNQHKKQVAAAAAAAAGAHAVAVQGLLRESRQKHQQHFQESKVSRIHVPLWNG